MTLPAAGWFPDPQNDACLRWWDGVTWSAETTPAPRAATAVADVQDRFDALAVPAGPVFSVDTRMVSATVGCAGDVDDRLPGRTSPPRRVCVLSWGALLLAAASALVDPYAVVGLVALLLAVVGLARPVTTGGWRVAARSAAISALVLAAATTLVAASGAARLF